jgi:chaperonin GroES
VKLRALKGNVIVEPVLDCPQTSLIVPDRAKNRDMPKMGRVITMNGAWVTKKGVRVLAEFRPGQMIIFPKFTGTWVTFEGRELIQIKLHDVIGVIE